MPQWIAERRLQQDAFMVGRGQQVHDFSRAPAIVCNSIIDEWQAGACGKRRTGLQEATA
jgi:hypothetical protein